MSQAADFWDDDYDPCPKCGGELQYIELTAEIGKPGRQWATCLDCHTEYVPTDRKNERGEIWWQERT